MFFRGDMNVNQSRCRSTPAALVAVLVLAMAQYPPTANAETVIYKSTDANGRVSYGDAPPSSAVAVEEIRLPDARPVDERDLRERKERVESLAATADRLRSDRMERENRRAAEAAPTVPPTDPPDVYYPQYRISRGPWLAPNPFGAHRWRQFGSPRGYGEDWRGIYQQPSRHGPPPHPRHRRSVMRNPPGR